MLVPQLTIASPQLHNKSLLSALDQVTLHRSLSGQSAIVIIAQANKMEGKLKQLVGRKWHTLRLMLQSSVLHLYKEGDDTDPSESLKMCGAVVSMLHEGSVKDQKHAFTFKTMSSNKMLVLAAASEDVRANWARALARQGAVLKCDIRKEGWLERAGAVSHTRALPSSPALPSDAFVATLRWDMLKASGYGDTS
jgi:hypothetical protein